MKPDYGGIRVSPSEISDGETIRHAIDSVKNGGKLDVVVVPAPSTIKDAEEITKKLYGYAPARTSDLDFTVLLGGTENSQKWDADFTKSTLKSSDAGNSFFGKYDTVAVGGTWDHLHWGHRLMLTLAAYASRSTVVIGVTGTELLVNKRYADALEPYAVRAEEAKRFVNYLNPKVKVETYSLDNMYGPTITVEKIEALVVSSETSKGGGQVNDKRKELGWRPLDIIEVGLVPGLGSDKLSSTDIRKEQHDKKHKI